MRALLSSDVFNLYAGALHASVKAVVNFTDCYPVVSDRVCQIVFVCFVIKHRHIVHKYIMYFERMEITHWLVLSLEDVLLRHQ